MKNFFGKLIESVKQFFGIGYYRLAATDSNEPAVVKDNTVYVIGENSFVWYLMLRCPCGCGEIIKLNTQEDTYPSWQLQSRSKLCSITPSIWRVVGCKSHFWLTNGKIKWVKN